MKTNGIKFVFGLAAVTAFLAIGCQKEEDPTANLTDEQKASISDEEAASMEGVENYDSGSSPDDRKE